MLTILTLSDLFLERPTLASTFFSHVGCCKPQVLTFPRRFNMEYTGCVYRELVGISKNVILFYTLL